MKTKAISSLFTGKSFPYEAAPPKDKEYWVLLNKCQRQMENFMHKLPPEYRDELEAMQSHRQEAMQFEIQQAFAQGYSLGVRLTAEAFLIDQIQE